MLNEDISYNFIRMLLLNSYLNEDDLIDLIIEHNLNISSQELIWILGEYDITFVDGMMEEVQ